MFGDPVGVDLDPTVKIKPDPTLGKHPDLQLLILSTS